MALNNIELLLEKYENAETTLSEEAELRAFFQSDNVAAHLEVYKPMFQYFLDAKTEQSSKDVPLISKVSESNNTKWYTWISLAAVAVLMLGIFMPNWTNAPKTLADYSKEEQQLYRETKQALAMLSNRFNDGASSLQVLNLASENFSTGIEKASHVSAFSKTTKKLLKN